MPHLYFRSIPSKCLSFQYKADSDFKDIHDELSSIKADIDGVSGDAWLDHKLFAVLELVSNSLRAHREHHVVLPVHVEMGIDDQRFHVVVKDAGRGFNPTTLPYDIDGPFDGVDPMSDSFQQYREKHQFLRFGMGMISAKKAFREFRLQFVDHRDEAVPWYSGKVFGTRIDLIDVLGGRGHA